MDTFHKVKNDVFRHRGLVIITIISLIGSIIFVFTSGVLNKNYASIAEAQCPSQIHLAHVIDGLQAESFDYESLDEALPALYAFLLQPDVESHSVTINNLFRIVDNQFLSEFSAISEHFLQIPFEQIPETANLTAGGVIEIPGYFLWDVFHDAHATNSLILIRDTLAVEPDTDLSEMMLPRRPLYFSAEVSGETSATNFIYQYGWVENLPEGTRWRFSTGITSGYAYLLNPGVVEALKSDFNNNCFDTGTSVSITFADNSFCGADDTTYLMDWDVEELGGILNVSFYDGNTTRRFDAVPNDFFCTSNEDPNIWVTTEDRRLVRTQISESE